MVARYFGLPGAGKTTVLAMLALRAVRSGRYRAVYSNVHLSVPGVSFIEFDYIGKYNMTDCLILIDEAMVWAGDRDHKNFTKEKLWAFVEHRHFNQDIILFSQEADGVDKKIRSISARMYYIKKGFFLGHWFSSIVRIPYDVMFPDPKSDSLGEIVMGYKKPPFLTRLFAKRVYRPKYYKYFNSWELDKQLPPLPDSVEPVPYNRSTFASVWLAFVSWRKYFKPLRRRLLKASGEEKKLPL